MLSLHQVATMWPREWLPSDQRPVFPAATERWPPNDVIALWFQRSHHRLWQCSYSDS
jgi:hypothetical protein